MIKQMQEENTNQISLTDPESKLMPNNGKFDVAYNVQTGVDATTHITLGFIVDNNPADSGSMSTLGEEIKKAYGEEKILRNTTDKGYLSPIDMTECLENGIIPQVTSQDKEAKSVELETEYEEAEISEEERKSQKPEDIKNCLRAGVIPECYKDVIENITVIERRRKKTEKSEGEEQVESTEEIIDRAMQEGKFIKDENTGCVACPMGQLLGAKSKRDNGERVRYANKLACKECKNKCMNGKFKEIEMGKNQKELIPKNNQSEGARKTIVKKGKMVKEKKVKIQLKLDKEFIKKRMAISEHSQGTMKNVDNFFAFRLKGKENASGEIALHFLASNIRCVGNREGVVSFLEKLKKYQESLKNSKKGTHINSFLMIFKKSHRHLSKTCQIFNKM